MPSRVYIETTIPSYLTAWPSADIVRSAHQKITQEWWDRHRTKFALVVSELVIQECSAGDQEAAAARLEAIATLPLIGVNEIAGQLAQALIATVPFPPKAAADALHIATAAVHDIEYLLTWNCAHLANAAIRVRVESVCRDRGYRAPIICTPEELSPEDADVSG